MIKWMLYVLFCLKVTYGINFIAELDTPNCILVHSNNRFLIWIDVKGFQFSIQTSWPNMDWILKSTGQNWSLVGIFDPQIIVGNIVKSDIFVPRWDQKKLGRIWAKSDRWNPIFRRVFQSKFTFISRFSVWIRHFVYFCYSWLVRLVLNRVVFHS